MISQHTDRTQKVPALYLVPTPIGNLGDITLRAIDVLRSVDTVLAEDTRTTGFLLKHLQITKPIHSYHIFNEHKSIEKLIQRMKSGETMALLSDAGTPGISDPGYLLIRSCLKQALCVESLPGPTALIPAVTQSGFPCDRFIFEGFLPHKKGKRSRILKLVDEERTTIFYESPHRLLKTLTLIVECCGHDRCVSVSRELTKIYEETFTGLAHEVLAYFEQKEIRGEFVIVVAGNQFTL